MSYVIETDYSRIISKTDLDDLLDEMVSEFPTKTRANAREESEESAEALIKSYLSIRYDMAVEFALDASTPAEAAAREKTILRCYLVLSVYFLQFSINPRDIPEIREKDYNNCLAMLDRARKGEVFLELIENASGDVTRMIVDGNRKFRSKPYGDASLFNE